MDKIRELAQALTDSASAKEKNKTSAYDTSAEVISIEGNTAWIRIPGGVERTPAKMVVSAKQGDEVYARITGGKAYITGNASAPPTDDTLARNAQQNALAASKAAIEAVSSAEIARKSASEAQADARTANVSATRAVADAARAQEAADSAQADAARAQESADIAQESAETAQADANTANQASTAALNQLGIVEDVVGVLDLISQHGDYRRSLDTTIQPNTWYFEKQGTGANEKYVVVTPQEGDDPSAEGWYVLTGIDQAIKNYVSSHLTLTNEGLYLQADGVATRILLSPTDGVVIMGQNGALATYGSATLIGDANSFHVTIDSQELGFWKDANTKVAYVKSDSLYIEKSVVVQRMDVGQSIENGGRGQWTWRVHQNKETIPRNNLSLKWLG